MQAWQHRIKILTFYDASMADREILTQRALLLLKFKLRNRFKLRQQPKKSTIIAAVQEFWRSHNNKRPPGLNAPSKDFDMK